MRLLKVKIIRIKKYELQRSIMRFKKSNSGFQTFYLRFWDKKSKLRYKSRHISQNYDFSWEYIHFSSQAFRSFHNFFIFNWRKCSPIVGLPPLILFFFLSAGLAVDVFTASPPLYVVVQVRFTFNSRHVNTVLLSAAVLWSSVRTVRCV